MDRDDFLNLDYLVFSSHKTMTQSMRATLAHNGFKCSHTHGLQNLGLDEPSFAKACKEYRTRNNTRLKVISVFRDPVERMISSFFQSLSVEKYGRTMIGQICSLQGLSMEEMAAESVLFQESFQNLQERFWFYSATINGFGEALTILCRSLGIKCHEIAFDTDLQFTRTCLADVDLYVARFDVLKQDFLRGMESVTGTPLKQMLVNSAEKKWYLSKYNHFRDHVRMPEVFLLNIYEARRELCEVFYPGFYERLLQERILRYV